MTGRRVLAIGLDPATIDFTSDFFRGKPIDAAKIAAGIDADRTRIRALGHDFEWLLLDAKANAAAGAEAVRAALAARAVDVVVIGGGVRLDPSQTALLEALVNAVTAASPGTKLAFNTAPTDTAEAIARV